MKDIEKFFQEYTETELHPWQEELMRFFEKYDPPYKIIHTRKGSYLSGTPKSED